MLIRVNRLLKTLAVAIAMVKCVTLIRTIVSALKRLHVIN